MRACCGSTGARPYLLDEPTNHVDIPGQEQLEAELLDHGATCILASHDRSFVRAVAPLYKKMRRAHLEMYRNTGIIRLSSLSRYRDIVGAGIQDSSEGLIYSFLENPVATLSFVAQGGSNALLYCTTLASDAQFEGYDATLRIVDHRRFHAALARAARSKLCESGLSINVSYARQCHYQHTRAMIDSLPDRHIELVKNIGTQNGGLDTMASVVSHTLLQPAFYLAKHVSYKADREVRLIIQCNGRVPDFIDISAPETRNYCEFLD